MSLATQSFGHGGALMKNNGSDGTAINVTATSDLAALGSELIVDRVVRAIMEHRLPPGTKLSESVLCRSFQASRSTVRRALLLLGERGIVSLEANRGAFIASPSPEEARAVFEARRTIEPSIIAKATQWVTANEVASLKAHLMNESRARELGAHHDAIRLSGEFHVALAVYARNPLLERFVSELVARTSLIIGLFGSPNTTHCLSDDHLSLLDALVRKDAAAASELMSRHLSHIEAGIDLSGGHDATIDVARVLVGSLQA